MNFDSTTVFTAFGLTLFAGLSTGIGSVIAWFAKRTSTRFLSIMLGFSAGVMIYVSMIELFQQAQILLTASLGVKQGAWITVAGFFGGMIVIALIDRFVPDASNPHETKMIESHPATANSVDAVPVTPANKKLKSHSLRLTASPAQGKLMRMGFLTALAITIHNFPEGIATLTAALKDPSLGVTIAVAIAIHNIPEGIAVSVPIYYATGNKKKAFLWSLLSGLSEPLGALIGYLVLVSVMNDVVSGVLLAGVAGIMVFISVDVLLPAAREYGEAHLSIYGLIAGMAVMAVSLLMFL